MYGLLKDPDAVLDYHFNWSDWLASGETINSKVIAVATGITLDTSSELNGVVTVWLSGGTDGETYTVACKITTTAGRTDERTMEIIVKDR
jgi:hypothetical protein